MLYRVYIDVCYKSETEELQRVEEQKSLSVLSKERAIKS